MKKNSLITDMFEIRKGNISNISDSEGFRKAIKEYESCLGELADLLRDNSKGKELVNSIDSLKDICIIETQNSAYAYGFRLGFSLCLDILSEEL